VNPHCAYMQIKELLSEELSAERIESSVGILIKNIE
jgi:hypothetical protein